MLKLIAVLCLVSLLPNPALAATKTTVSQLDKLLADLYQQHKTDDAVASKLKDIELTEQLTAPAMNNLMQYKPGPYTIRQILLLSVESSLLPPSPADLPTLPAPSNDAQADLMRRATDYVAHDIAQTPKITAEKQTIRFQNGISHVQNTSGNGSSFSENHDPTELGERIYPSLIGQQTGSILSEGGVELQPPVVKQKDPASQYGQISQGTPGLPLTGVLLDVARSSTAWLRWQTINGRQTAVFSFSVNPKESHYKVNYCCFPILDHVGSGMGFTPSSGSVTTFQPFAAAPAYHGELFIDSVTGIIVRLITKADLKPTDFVQQEDIRVDYASVAVGDKHYIVPAKSMILTTVIPNGDSYVKFSTRRTLFDVTYSKYQRASAPPQATK